MFSFNIIYYFKCFIIYYFKTFIITISKTRAGSIRTVELKGPLPKAMNIGDGTAKKYELMGRAVWPKGWWWRRPEGKDPEWAVWWRRRQLSHPVAWRQS